MPGRRVVIATQVLAMPMPHEEPKLELHVHGLPLNEGPCPTLLYFAVSGRESLHLDPFSQPVDYFLDGKSRVISMDLPFHGEGYEKEGAMSLWAISLAAEDDYIGRFIHQAKAVLEDLKARNIIEPARFAVAGLSRGGFFAAHLAAQTEWIHNVVAFAPLTLLERLAEFENIAENPLLKKWSLMRQTENLSHKRMRFYIGNNDTRVDTDACYSLLRAIVKKAKVMGVRTAHTEMIMTPSVGFKGHGTLPHVFEDGINWIKSCLEYTI